MKLYITAGSPYARIARTVVARLHDLNSDLDDNAPGLRVTFEAPSSDLTGRSPNARVPLHAIFGRALLVDSVREVVEVTSL